MLLFKSVISLFISSIFTVNCALALLILVSIVVVVLSPLSAKSLAFPCKIAILLLISLIDSFIPSLEDLISDISLLTTAASLLSLLMILFCIEVLIY